MLRYWRPWYEMHGPKLTHAVHEMDFIHTLSKHKSVMEGMAKRIWLIFPPKKKIIIIKWQLASPPSPKNNREVISTKMASLPLQASGLRHKRTKEKAKPNTQHLQQQKKKRHRGDSTTYCPRGHTAGRKTTQQYMLIHTLKRNCSFRVAVF